jgi:lipopolysaccharide transport system permease protein
LVTAVSVLAGGGLHLAVVALPLVLAPYLALLYGLSLCLASLGVYVRDLGQITGVLVMLVLFTGAVFFPRDMVPPALAAFVDLNPITWPVEAARGVLLHGQWPSPASFVRYSAAAGVVLALGWTCFARLRRGFADVL